MIAIAPRHRDEDTVRLKRVGDHWEAMTFGMGCSRSICELYTDAALPKFLSDPLAVLSLLPPPPPINDVAGLGRRISSDTFWIYLPPE